MTTTDTPTVDNGVNIEALRGAREALTNHPEAASFQWRASCEWVRGTHSRTTITDFSGLGAEHVHRQVYTVDADHPEVFASEDNGPPPPRSRARRWHRVSRPVSRRWRRTAASSCIP